MHAERENVDGLGQNGEILSRFCRKIALGYVQVVIIQYVDIRTRSIYFYNLI